MVLPMDSSVSTRPPPPCVREASSKLWWFLVFVYAALAVARVVMSDYFGALVTGLMAFWAYEMVKQDCTRMSQTWVFMFGSLCFCEFLIDAMDLLSCLPGRFVEKTVYAPTSHKNGMTISQSTVTIAEHPLFYSRGGPLYNSESALLFVNPLLDILGLAISVYAYNIFPTSLFDDEEDALLVDAEWNSLGIAAQGSSGNFPGYGGAQAAASAMLARVSGVNAPRSNPPVGAFRGASCKLGDDEPPTGADLSLQPVQIVDA